MQDTTWPVKVNISPKMEVRRVPPQKQIFAACAEPDKSTIRYRVKGEVYSWWKDDERVHCDVKAEERFGWLMKTRSRKPMVLPV